jgi:hypothetical protein
MFGVEKKGDGGTWLLVGDGGGERKNNRGEERFRVLIIFY